MKTFFGRFCANLVHNSKRKMFRTGVSNSRPPGCVMLPAIAFVNYVYTTIITQLFGVYVYHFL
jgi:hypothetical protein